MTLVSVGGQSLTLPVVTGHSETRVIVNRGDIVSLRVGTKIDGYDIQWWLKKDKLCQGNLCRVDTGSWLPGAHKIVTIISNDKGSEFVSFYFLVKEKLDTSAPQIIEPDFIKSDIAPKEFSRTEPYALAIKGSGFSWRADKLNLLKSVPRGLDWDEKLKSSGGVLQIGSLDADEHFLMPGTDTRLAKAGDRRIIILNSGTLRSRQLDLTKEPQWTVIVGDWLQLDGVAGKPRVLKKMPVWPGFGGKGKV